MPSRVVSALNRQGVLTCVRKAIPDVQRNRQIFLHRLRDSVVNEIEKEPEHVKRQVTSSVNEIQPSLGHDFAVAITDGNVRHLFQHASQRLGAMPLLTWVGPIDAKSV